MFVTALIASLVTTVLATLFSVIKSDRRGSVFNFDGSNLGAAVITFIVVLFADWGALYWNFGRPIWAGAGWIGFMVINLIIVTIIFGIASMAGDLNATPFVSVGTILVILVGVLGLYNNFWLGQDSATTLATQLNVKIIDQNEHGAANATELVAKVYPPTDANHMVIVGDQAARNIANRVMNQQNVGTRYTLGDGNLQSVAGHMFYVFDLRTSDIRSAGTVNYEAPGYVKVDAENPDAQPELVTQLNNKPLTLKYLLNGYYASNVERYAYEAFPNYYVDDLSLEIDDTGRPFWTASLNSAPRYACSTVCR